MIVYYHGYKWGNNSIEQMHIERVKLFESSKSGFNALLYGLLVSPLQRL